MKNFFTALVMLACLICIAVLFVPVALVCVMFNAVAFSWCITDYALNHMDTKTSKNRHDHTPDHP